MLHILYQIWKNVANTGSRGVRLDFFQYCIGGDFPNLLQYYMGGSSQFITILHKGGVYCDHKFVLPNKWTAPNARCAVQDT